MDGIAERLLNGCDLGPNLVHVGAPNHACRKLDVVGECAVVADTDDQIVGAHVAVTDAALVADAAIDVTLRGHQIADLEAVSPLGVATDRHDFAEQLVADDAAGPLGAQRFGFFVERDENHVLERAPEPNPAVGPAEADESRLDQHARSVVIIALLVEHRARRFRHTQAARALPGILVAIVDERAHLFRSHGVYYDAVRERSRADKAALAALRQQDRIATWCRGP